MEESFSEERQLGDLWHARYLRTRERYFRDAISKLPDSLLSQILSCLPTKEAVNTSVLSSRWKNLWLLIPKLDLASSEFPDYNAFVGFMDRFLDFSREDKSILHELKLNFGKNENDQSCLTRWIDSVASPKLKRLDVECRVNRKFVEPIPQSLFLICDTLVYLRLNRVSLVDYESVSLPCLKTMRLEHNVYASDACVESLISSCLLLQDLSIVRMVPDNIKFLRVRSQTLTSLHIEYLFGEGDDFDDSSFEKEGSGVLIDAPSLKYLKFEDELSDSKIITNSGSLTKVNVVYVFGEIDDGDAVDLPKQNMVRNFFTSISGVKEMKISLHTIEFLEFNMESYPLPQFLNLSTLKVTFSLSNLGLMPTVLESFPNLKSLVLLLDYIPSREKEEVRLSPVPVPQCLLSSLESVKIKRFFRGPANMEIARYFLENSLVLKKLVLHLRFSTVEEGFYMLKDLLALPRRSSTCQILDH